MQKQEQQEVPPVAAAAAPVAAAAAPSVEEVDDNSINDTQAPQHRASVAGIMARKRKAHEISLAERESKYVDARFIFGSAAEVERLWSIASRVLTKE